MSLNLREFLTDVGYTDLRVVRGKVCGLFAFGLTTGLVVGLDLTGCECAYSYENESDARAALTRWDGEGHPSGPWIRLTGLAKGCVVDMRNPVFAAPVFGRVAA
jgi:hypothetical protein